MSDVLRYLWGVITPYLITGIVIAAVLLGTFYLGYIFAIDIFELWCFRTELPSL